MTTKHHEGFCHFDSKLTDYCAPKQGPGRDLVKEYVEAARAEGLRVGFYYSLMDWHHPDGARCATDEAARRRFVDYIHGQIRELLTNYGKIDMLWYDVAWPLDAKGWESEKMNAMVFQLQPDIIVNNRNKLEGDFTTPEQRIEAQKRRLGIVHDDERQLGLPEDDDDWKTPKTVVRNLITCARDTGNYLLNIGPKGGRLGSRGVGADPDARSGNGWTATASRSTDRSSASRAARATRASRATGNTLYMHIHFWPGDTPIVARTDEPGEVGADAGDRQRDQVRAGQVPRQVSRACREGA